jgi:stage V sporulation protein R
MSKLLYKSNEWTFDKLDKAWKVIDKIAKTKYGLDYYEPQIEIISSDQMLDCHCSHAMPVMYKHWSFGKMFAAQKEMYSKGHENLAYEVVINTNPSIAYCLENNTMTMQCLVLAHAACGHNHFFKNNYMFKEFTNANSILHYLRFARDYVEDCEKKYGFSKTEETLDKAHSLMYNSIDKYPRKHVKNSDREERKKIRSRHEEESASEFDNLFCKKVKERKLERTNHSKTTLPEYNLLYFIEKNSIALEEWQRELCRIVRKVSQYFYPQIQTKVMNEGFASFMHYNIMNDLYDQGHIEEGHLLEALMNHTSVLTQYNKSPLNPYVLGYKIFEDIKRICQKPTQEDLEWFPHLKDQNWLDVIKDVVVSQKDSSFIENYLSPKVIRDLKLFALYDGGKDTFAYDVVDIHNSDGYLEIRRALSRQYNFINMFPEISIVSYKMTPIPKISLLYDGRHGKKIDSIEYEKVMRNFCELMGISDMNCKTTFLDEEE